MLWVYLIYFLYLVACSKSEFTIFVGVFECIYLFIYGP